MAASAEIFGSIPMLAAAGVVCAVVVVVGVARRIAMPMGAGVVGGVGMVLLCLAAGGMQWRRHATGEVLVMVDQSASVRPAGYRDWTALQRRVRQLAGDAPVRVVDLSGQRAVAPPSGERLAETAGERMVFDPPGAAVALLFSDGQFHSPPPAALAGGGAIFPVLDPALESPADAAVVNIEQRGDAAAVTVRNSGQPRRLSIAGVRDGAGIEVGGGTYLVTRQIDPGATVIAASLSPGDAWPENDALRAPVLPGVEAESWIVGDRTPGAGWRAIAPDALPADPAAYLAPRAIVLDNIAAADLTVEQRDRLWQYVHDLGGSLVILGGRRAFAAGGYSGTTLDALSPLASHPPLPTTHWMLLTDASGSMNAAGGDGAEAGGPTRWQYAAAALLGVLPSLPADDRLSVGSFSEKLNWWVRDAAVSDARAQQLPPADASPGGPTNLRAALDAVAGGAAPTPPKELLLLTDADADIDDPVSLIAALRAKQIRLHLLALAAGRGLGALRQVVEATGGELIEQPSAARWAAAVRELMGKASPTFLHESPLGVHFIGPLARLGERSVNPWNRTWIKPAAAALAEAEFDGEPLRPVAQWNLGEGRVMAASFAVGDADIASLSRAIARPPRDPRYRITWETGARLHVTVDAAGADEYLNGRSLLIELSPSTGAATAPAPQPLTQTAPGRYEASMPAPSRPGFAAIRGEGGVLDRIALPGRYAPEFEGIGTDHEQLRRLAEASGGFVVDPMQTKPITFPWPRRTAPLAPWLASIGAALLAISLVWRRIS